MEITISIPHVIDVKYLHCYIQPRYWEDSVFNDKEDDENGTLVKELLPNSIMTCQDMVKLGLNERHSEGFFHLVIDLENGTVKDWPKDNTAKFGYKSCDMNVFILENPYGNTIYSTKDTGCSTEYMIGPEFMNDYGDYFVLKVDKDGKIVDWDEYKMKRTLEAWIFDE